jgi:hypothetical protein
MHVMPVTMVPMVAAGFGIRSHETQGEQDQGDLRQ